MGSEVIILVSVVVATFILSLSFVMNVIFGLSLVGGGLVFRNLFKGYNSLQKQIDDMESEVIMSDSISDIVEQILTLRDELEEVIQMDMYVGEPVLTGLMGRVSETLEKIEYSIITQEYKKSLEVANGE